MCCLKPRLESSGMVQWLSPKVSYIAYVLGFMFSKRDLRFRLDLRISHGSSKRGTSTIIQISLVQLLEFAKNSLIEIGKP